MGIVQYVLKTSIPTPSRNSAPASESDWLPVLVVVLVLGGQQEGHKLPEARLRVRVVESASVEPTTMDKINHGNY